MPTRKRKIPAAPVVQRPTEPLSVDFSSLEAIAFASECSDMQLEMLIHAINHRRDADRRQALSAIQRGDRVTFTPSKGSYRGVTLEGTASRINRKSIYISNVVTYASRHPVLAQWRVHPTLLTVVSKVIK